MLGILCGGCAAVQEQVWHRTVIWLFFPAALRIAMLRLLLLDFGRRMRDDYALASLPLIETECIPASPTVHSEKLQASAELST